MTIRARARAGVAGRVLAVALLGLVVGCSSGSDDLPVDAVSQAPADGPASSTRPAAVSSAPTTVAVTQTAGPDARATLPPGTALPSDAECAGRVVKSPEVRPKNATANQTRGKQKHLQDKWLDRVTGDFSGTTDEILQWVACKWGINVDIVRAQAAKESYWSMDTLSDYGSDPAACPPKHPIGADGTRGQCPQSVGILQARYQYTGPPAGLDTWPEIEESTAYNLDFAYANWRSCYEGDKEWLNTVDRGREYAAGDIWGCVGIWFSGRWYSKDANEYVDAIKKYLESRIWTTSSFINAR